MKEYRAKVRKISWDGVEEIPILERCYSARTRFMELSAREPSRYYMNPRTYNDLVSDKNFTKYFKSMVLSDKPRLFGADIMISRFIEDNIVLPAYIDQYGEQRFTKEDKNIVKAVQEGEFNYNLNKIYDLTKRKGLMTPRAFNSFLDQVDNHR